MKFVVNGCEIEYDPFDLDAIEIWDDTIDSLNAVLSTPKPENVRAIDALRAKCNAMLDFFDAVCGEGTSQAIFGAAQAAFGTHISVKDLTDCFAAFTRDVGAVRSAVWADMKQVDNVEDQPKPNRAARRAEAKAKVTKIRVADEQ